MSQYTDDVAAEIRSLLEKNDTDSVVELVTRKLNTSWRNGYKLGYQDGKNGNPDKTLDQKEPVETS